MNKILVDVLQEIKRLEEVALSLGRLARSRGKRGRPPVHVSSQDLLKRVYGASRKN